MRLIGHLADESSARVFGDFLYARGIENQVENQKADGWGVWVSEEDRIGEATDMLDSFRKNPGDPKYRKEARNAAQLREEAEKGEAEYRKRVSKRRHLFRPLGGYGIGPLTIVLIAMSVSVAVLTKLGEDSPLLRSLLISESSSKSLTEVMHGDVWRLLTPIFIHFTLAHIFFNMMWLNDLGSMIEGRQSSLHLLLLVVGVGIGSNLTQFYARGPGFGGMSGVVYGLLGYIWIRGKLDPASGLFVSQTTVIMMIAWFVLCALGVMGDVANYAHAGGLIIGMAWGYLSSLRHD